MDVINNNGAMLAKYEAARAALTAAVSVDEVKQIHDVATAMQAYARQSKDRQMEFDAKVIRARALRRLGQMIQAQKETVGLNQGAKPGKTGVKNTPVLDDRPTLADAGIDKNLAKAARKAAAETEAEFEAGLKPKERKPRPPQAKEPGRKRAKHPKTASPEVQKTVAETVFDKGKSIKQAATEAGVSGWQVQAAVAKEDGRRQAIEESDAFDVEALLNASNKEKLAVAIRQHKKKLDAEYAERRRVEIAAYIKDIWTPDMQKLLDDAKLTLQVYRKHKSIMPVHLFNLIKRCLHPNILPDIRGPKYVPQATDAKIEARFHEAFIAFNDLRVLLLSEKDAPTSGISLKEMHAAAVKRRQAAQAARGKARAPARR